MKNLKNKIIKDKLEHKNFCVECKKNGIMRPIWKGTHSNRNYWKLYCKEHEEKINN